MPRIAYVNGRYVPFRDASVHIEDRGYQFADGVYEVVAVFGGKLVDEEAHLDRLERSLSELKMQWPVARRVLSMIMSQVVRRNKVRDGMVYVQVTRGVATRDHAFPTMPVPSSLVVTAKGGVSKDKVAAQGVSVITLPDIRWARCDIKTVSLIPNVLAKQTAKEQGAFDAWLVDRDGFITEGAAANAWIITKNNELVTRHSGQEILTGITRMALINLAKDEGLTLVERPFTPQEVEEAQEAFTSSSTALIMPVVKIDGKPIGDGKPGPLATKLRTVYVKAAREQGGAA